MLADFSTFNVISSTTINVFTGEFKFSNTLTICLVFGASNEIPSIAVNSLSWTFEDNADFKANLLTLRFNLNL